jgi:erythromycin esterase-like protein
MSSEKEYIDIHVQLQELERRREACRPEYVLEPTPAERWHQIRFFSAAYEALPELVRELEALLGERAEEIAVAKANAKLVAENELLKAELRQAREDAEAARDHALASDKLTTEVEKSKKRNKTLNDALEEIEEYVLSTCDGWLIDNVRKALSKAWSQPDES